MRNLKNELKNRKINYKELLKYGFIKEKDAYMYKTKICNNQFEIIIEAKENEIISKLMDLENEEEYVLVDIEGSTGEFVGKVRDEYEKVLTNVIKQCTNLNIFKSKQSKEIIQYIKEKYNGELEFLWEKFEDTAIWRNKKNKKWYGLICTISENKIGIDSEKEVEIIDLRYQKGETVNIIDNKKIFAGYHMNKNSWITIKMDNSVDTKKVKELIDNSYNLVIDNK